MTVALAGFTYPMIPGARPPWRRRDQRELAPAERLVELVHLLLAAGRHGCQDLVGGPAIAELAADAIPESIF